MTRTCSWSRCLLVATLCLAASGCGEADASVTASVGAGGDGGGCVVGGCGVGGGVASSSSASAGGGAGGSGEAGGAGGTGGTGGAGGAGGAAMGGGGVGGDGGAGVEIAAFDFAGEDGDPWPGGWEVSGGVQVADLQGGRARLAPTLGVEPYPLARMHLPGDEANVEISFVVTFADASQQGLGFYARQNGGHLALSDPAGQGYAVFVCNAPTLEGIGVWQEENGHEQELQRTPFALADDTPYRVRFQVEQQDLQTTRLRARIWLDGDEEPSAWAVEQLAEHAHLQGLSDGFAVDAYYSGDLGVAPDVYLDDVQIHRLP